MWAADVRRPEPSRGSESSRIRGQQHHAGAETHGHQPWPAVGRDRVGYATHSDRVGTNATDTGAPIVRSRSFVADPAARVTAPANGATIVTRRSGVLAGSRRGI
jgi:hypothetical protein